MSHCNYTHSLVGFCSKCGWVHPETIDPSELAALRTQLAASAARVEELERALASRFNVTCQRCGGEFLLTIPSHVCGALSEAHCDLPSQPALSAAERKEGM
jgi:hypothetical protein